MYAGSGAGPAVKPTEVHRLKIYIELIRFHYGGLNLNAATVYRFFHYDRAIGEEAQRSLNDLLRLEVKDAETSRDKKKKDQALEKAKGPLCLEWEGWLQARGRLRLRPLLFGLWKRGPWICQVP